MININNIQSIFDSHIIIVNEMLLRRVTVENNMVAFWLSSGEVFWLSAKAIADMECDDGMPEHPIYVAVDHTGIHHVFTFYHGTPVKIG